MMEEHELEEGEACYYNKDDDDNSSIDPDIALSYIVRVLFFLCYMLNSIFKI